MELTRRTFLKSSATIAATAAVSTKLLAEDAPKKRAIKKAIMYSTIGIKGSVMEKFAAVKAAGFEGVEAMSHMDQKIGRAHV